MSSNLDRPPTLIGICGKMGAGKDEVGNILFENHGYLKTSFAHELRKEVQEALLSAYLHNEKARKHFPVVPQEKDAAEALKAFEKIVWDAVLNEINQTGNIDFGVWAKPTSALMRVLLQWWGTDYRRAEDENYWIKRWLSAHIPSLIAGERLCICDVRYNNEAAMCKLMGVIWEVYGRNIEINGLKDHASEKGINLVFDLYIPNHSTLEKLAQTVSYGVKLWR